MGRGEMEMEMGRVGIGFHFFLFWMGGNTGIFVRGGREGEK